MVLSGEKCTPSDAGTGRLFFSHVTEAGFCEPTHCREKDLPATGRALEVGRTEMGSVQREHSKHSHEGISLLYLISFFYSKIRWEQHHRLTNDSEVLSGGNSGLRYSVCCLAGQRLNFRVVTKSDLQMTVKLSLFPLMQDGYGDLVPRESLPHVLPCNAAGRDARDQARERVLFPHRHCTVASDDDV